jgi:hypothetical protein
MSPQCGCDGCRHVRRPPRRQTACRADKRFLESILLSSDPVRTRSVNRFTICIAYTGHPFIINDGVWVFGQTQAFVLAIGSKILAGRSFQVSASVTRSPLVRPPWGSPRCASVRT